MKPKLTAIVPVYNAEDYLEACVSSILAQTFSDFELLLVNDGSSDSSAALCDGFAAADARVRVIHKANGGVSSARNAGIEAAQGDWLSFIDADDTIAPSMFEKLLNKATADNAEVVCCSFNKGEHNGRITRHDPTFKSLPEYIGVTYWNVVWASIQSAAIYRRHNLRFDTSLPFCEDFELMVRVFAYAKAIATVDEPLYNYTYVASSAVHSMKNDRRTEAKARAITEIAAFLDFRGLNSRPYRQAEGWRALYFMRPWIFRPEMHRRFIETIPAKRDFVWSCPWFKGEPQVRLMAWCLTHGLRPVTLSILKLRKILHRS